MAVRTRFVNLCICMATLYFQVQVDQANFQLQVVFSLLNVLTKQAYKIAHHWLFFRYLYLTLKFPIVLQGCFRFKRRRLDSVNNFGRLK